MNEEMGPCNATASPRNTITVLHSVLEIPLICMVFTTYVWGNFRESHSVVTDVTAQYCIISFLQISSSSPSFLPVASTGLATLLTHKLPSFSSVLPSRNGSPHELGMFCLLMGSAEC